MRKKLLRTMGRYRAQFLSMIVMIAIGIGVFVGFNVEWYTIERDTASFFEKTGFADFRVLSETGFSEEDRRAVEALDGVSAAARWLSVNTMVKDDADVLALTVTEDPAVSGFLVTSGGAYDAADAGGFWLSDRYAEANGIAVGDGLTLTYKGLEIAGTVRGLIKAGEYLICLPDETQLMPDYTAYGFVYAAPSLLERVLGRAFYTQINALSGLDKTAFSERVDEALGRTMLVLSKDDVVSYAEAMGESEEGKTMGGILPVLFLGIAVLTMVTTMHRLTASEKTQIGTLKALGFRDGRITRHYVSYALTVGLTGTALGLLLGWLLGWYLMNPGGPMGTYLDMDDWSLHAPPFVWIVLAAVNGFLLLVGLWSVRAMLKGTAADSLRPYVPQKVRSLLLERTRLWDRLSFGTKWNLRDSLRHKARSGMTLFGIVGCTVLLVGALGMKDTADAFIRLFYDEAIRYESRVNLDAASVSAADAAELSERYDGDRLAQSSVQVDGAFVGVEVYGLRSGLVRFVDTDSNFIELSDDGVYLCRRIAEAHGLEPGDTLRFSPFGSDKSYTARVAGTVRSMTESVVMTEACAERIGYPYVTNVIYTAETEIEADARIVNVQTRQSVLDSFDTFMQIMDLMVVLLAVAAVVLGIVVLYNLGVMNYTERYREMAALKVIGFRDRRIGRLLISQNLWMTVLGVAVGIPAGIGVLQCLLNALAAEYEMALSLGWATFTVSTLLTFGVSLLVGWMVAGKNRKIDMVEALKVPE